MAEKVHWTQTPEGRERIKKIAKAGAAKRIATMKANRKKADAQRVGKKSTHGAAARRKLSESMKARWAEVKRLQNGHAPAPGTNGHIDPALATYAGNSKKLIASAVRVLAVDGAQLRLEKLRQEQELLEMFIKSVGVRG